MTELLVALAVVAVVVVGMAAFYAMRQLRSSTRDRLGLANSITATLLARAAARPIPSPGQNQQL